MRILQTCMLFRMIKTHFFFFSVFHPTQSKYLRGHKVRRKQNDGTRRGGVNKVYRPLKIKILASRLAKGEHLL